MKPSQNAFVLLEARNLEVIAKVSRHCGGISQIADNMARTHRRLPPQRNQIALDDIDDYQVASVRGLRPGFA
jgi:hypothetical protein